MIHQIKWTSNTAYVMKLIGLNRDVRVSSAGSLDALAARDQSNVRPYGHKSFNQNSFNRLTVNYGASEKGDIKWTSFGFVLKVITDDHAVDTKAIRDHLEQERRERISSAQGLGVEKTILGAI